MWGKKMKIISFLAYVLSIGAAAAQSYSPMQLGIDKTSNPYAFATNVNNAWIGIGTINSNGAITYTPPSPSWGSYSQPYYPHVVNVNNLPQQSMPQGTGAAGQYTSIGMVSSIVGAIDTPSTDSSLAQPGNVPGFINIGTSGVSRSASTTKGAVGVFGGGMINAETAKSWGGNFVATNFPYLSGVSTNGFNNFRTSGLEVDVYLNNPASGSLTGTAIGIELSGQLQSSPSGGSYGVVINPAKTNQTLGWVCAICVVDGPNGSALNIGAQAKKTVSATAEAQLIRLNSYNSGKLFTSYIGSDIEANVLVKPGLKIDVISGRSPDGGSVTYATGLNIKGDLSAIPVGGAFGMVIDPAFADKSIGWNCAICIQDGPNNTAINVGANQAKTGSVTTDSQTISFYSIKSGNYVISTIKTDSDGDFIFNLADPSSNVVIGTYLKFASASVWVAATNCGSLAGSTGCLALKDNNGATKYVPVY